MGGAALLFQFPRTLLGLRKTPSIFRRDKLG